MYKILLLSAVTGLLPSIASAAVSCNVKDVGAYNGRFTVKDVVVSSTAPVSNWQVSLSFDRPVKVTKAWGASSSKVNNTTYTFKSLPSKGIAKNKSVSFGLKGTNGGKLGKVTCSVGKSSAATKPKADPKPKVTVKPKATPKPKATAKPRSNSGTSKSVGQSANNAGYIWYENMNNLATGSPSGKEWKKLWGSPFINGDENKQLRYAIDNKVDIDNDGKSIRILYPKGEQRSKASGAQWRTYIGNDYNEIYISYWVKFDKGFSWQLGGKLPGIGGAEDFKDLGNRTEGRMMWRPKGLVEFYIHVENVDDRQYQWDTERGGQVFFKQGQWHHIEMRYKMNGFRNGKPLANGIMEGWLDGKKAAFYNDAILRTSPTVGFNHLQFSTFFGGGSKNGARAAKDEFVWFDDIIISDTRINNYPGYTPK